MEKEEAQKLLLDLKRKLKKSIETLEAENTQPDGSESQAELSLYDNHPADIATEVFKREHDMAMKQNDVDKISAIDNALVKLEKGKYGYCEKCHENISDERLEILPYTRFCVQCEADLEHDSDRSEPNEVNALKHRKKLLRERDNDDIFETVFSTGFAGSSSTPSEVGRFRDYKDKGYVNEFEEINKSQGSLEIEPVE